MRTCPLVRSAVSALLFMAAAGWVAPCWADFVVREELEPGVYASLKGGRVLYLECRVPRGAAGDELLARYLADPSQSKSYKNSSMAVGIPYHKLRPEKQRLVLETVFPQDYVDEAGWWHMVIFEGEGGMETWWGLAEWLTGVGTNYHALKNHEENRQLGMDLAPGQRVLIARDILLDVMKTPSKRPTPPPRLAETTAVVRGIVPAEPPPEGGGVRLADPELKYGEDKAGPYAAYRLKKGEALYTAVVVRFTDYRENDDILRACEVVQQRSGIEDVRRMEAGDRVLIPVDMLSDRYMPEGTEQRAAYEEVRREAKRLQAERVRSKDLKGVVIILDAGHGGRDQGASIVSAGLYEDELSYDIMCRIKALIETQTQAKLYLTIEDMSQGYKPTAAKRFKHDQDERLLTTPPFANGDARLSANLRWHMANHHYRQERKNGVDDRKIIFVSIHCDAIFNSKLRGAMVYVPGAKYRSNREQSSKPEYARYAESRGQGTVLTTAAKRRRDEALSRNFATTLLHAMKHHNPPLKVHDASDPIRNVIRRSRGHTFLPAVLRYNLVPTKVLVETANMTNPIDQKRLADPNWRQWFAEAFVEALRRHFDS